MISPLEPAALDALRETGALRSLNQRSLDIFRRIVEGYLANGEPVGLAPPFPAAAQSAVPRLGAQRHGRRWRRAG